MKNKKKGESFCCIGSDAYSSRYNQNIEECLLFYTNIHIAGTHAVSQIGKHVHRLHVDTNKIQVDKSLYK
jgi:hypothetical protein